MRLLALTIACATMVAAAGPAAARARPSASPQAATWLLVVSGVGGDDERRAAFVELSHQLMDAAARHGVAADRIGYLAEAADTPRARARSTRENIESELQRLAGLAAPDDQVVIVLLGHGNIRAGEAYFNLPGPDISAGEFAIALTPLQPRQVAVVNTTAASGPFVRALAAPGRVVITATRGDRELLEPTFARFFIEAFDGTGADLDKDQRVSLLEAFRFANVQVERSYADTGRMRTEHAMLEDDGDGEGSEDPDGNREGALAARMTLGSGAMSTGAGESDPELRALYGRRAEAEARLAALRARQGEMTAEQYDKQLEEILVAIAEIDAAIRARGGAR